MEKLDSEKARYLLSFLVILVARAGGKVEINNLSEFSGKNVYVVYEPDFNNDRVVLKTVDLDRKVH